MLAVKRQGGFFSRADMNLPAEGKFEKSRHKVGDIPEKSWSCPGRNFDCLWRVYKRLWRFYNCQCSFYKRHRRFKFFTGRLQLFFGTFSTLCRISSNFMSGLLFHYSEEIYNFASD